LSTYPEERLISLISLIQKGDGGDGPTPNTHATQVQKSKQPSCKLNRNKCTYLGGVFDCWVLSGLGLIVFDHEMGQR
jgi:hypothetical protein